VILLKPSRLRGLRQIQRTTDYFLALDIERERRPKNMNLQRDLNIIQITVEHRKLGGS